MRCRPQPAPQEGRTRLTRPSTPLGLGLARLCPATHTGRAWSRNAGVVCPPGQVSSGRSPSTPCFVLRERHAAPEVGGRAAAGGAHMLRGHTGVSSATASQLGQKPEQTVIRKVNPM